MRERLSGIHGSLDLREAGQRKARFLPVFVDPKDGKSVLTDKPKKYTKYKPFLMQLVPDEVKSAPFALSPTGTTLPAHLVGVVDLASLQGQGPSS